MICCVIKTVGSWHLVIWICLYLPRNSYCIVPNVHSVYHIRYLIGLKNVFVWVNWTFNRSYLSINWTAVMLRMKKLVLNSIACICGVVIIEKLMIRRRAFWEQCVCVCIQFAISGFTSEVRSLSDHVLCQLTNESRPKCLPDWLLGDDLKKCITVTRLLRCLFMPVFVSDIHLCLTKCILYLCSVVFI